MFVSTSANSVRKRFSLAHELAHILIPWHVGSVLVSHLDENRPFATSGYREMEAEANRFAAELSLPTDWTRQRISAEASIAEIYECLKVAGVSQAVASFQICEAAPPGWFFVEISSSGRVVSTAKSAEAFFQVPPADFCRP